MVGGPFFVPKFPALRPERPKEVCLAKASNILIELKRLGVSKPRSVAQKIVKMKHSARKRGHLFDLPDNALCKLVLSSCHYCNFPGPNGLDRIQSSKPYVRGNVVPCCTYCNRAKSDMTMIEFRQWLETAYNFFIKRG